MMMKGVSNILSILLMIIVAVILSIVFGTFPFQLTQKIEPAPVTIFNVEFYKDAVVLEHAGGDPFNIKYARVRVTTHNGTYKIPFVENYMSRDVMLEIGETKAVMLKDCDHFDYYGRASIFWKDKIVGDYAKSVLNKWYSPSFVVNYLNTLNVNSFLGAVRTERGIVAVGSNYVHPNNGLILFSDQFGNVRSAYYATRFGFRDVAKCSDGYVIVGFKYAMKVDDSGNVVWNKYWRNRNAFYLVHSVACKGSVCALTGEGSYRIRIVLIDASDGHRLTNIVSSDLRVGSDNLPIRVFSVKDGWLVVGVSRNGGFAGLFYRSGNMLKQKFMKAFTNTYAIRGCAETKDGYILVGTTTGQNDVAVIKIDKNGNVIWAKRYDGGNSDEQAFGVYCDEKSKICTVVGHTGYINHHDIFVLKIDESDGRLLDSKVYDFGYDEYFDVVKPVFDYKGRFRGFVGGGRVGNYPAIISININGEIWGGSRYIVQTTFSESSLSVSTRSYGYVSKTYNPPNAGISLSSTSVTANPIYKCGCYP